MSFVLKRSGQYLGTDLDGEIIFGSISKGIKPLKFKSKDDAWETLEFAFPDMDIRYDLDNDKSYDVVDSKTVKFLAAIINVEVIE